MSAPTLESAFIRILINDSAGRAAAGAGFLAAPRHVLTCAHVVNTALRRGQTAPEQPDTLLALDFPLLPDQILLHAKILRWFPVRENAAVGELEDIAVLELPEDAPLPAGAQPAPLVLFEEYWGRQVRLHGFSVPAGTYANLTLQGLNTQGLIELHHQGSGVVAPGFSGTAVWSVQENAVCGMAVAVWKELKTAYMIPAAALIQAFPELDRCSRPVNPYRGMEAFREKDARFYFGRKDDAAALRQKIEQQPFTAVIGASGSGKSSLVFAGLLPVLRQSGDWLLAACRPKQQPFHELAASLIPFLYEDELERVKKSRQCAADLLSGELHLSDLLQRIAERNDCRRLLLLVDQFEELYTLNTDRAAARAFVAQLLAAQAEGFRAVITLRADFLEAALGDEVFAKTLNACQPLYLSPLDSHGLRLAVEQPAELFSIRFEAGLADLIVADVGTEPGGLPLLEFCLTQLWEQQAFRQISHAAYKSIGGVRQALARHADTVLAEFDQEAVRRIFLKLVRPGQGTEDTRQVAILSDFQEEQRGLIKQLADRRLLVTSGDEVGQQVEVAHEALIRHWQTLRRWVDAERDFLVWRDKLRLLLRQWQESDHDDGALLRGRPLHEALQWQLTHFDYIENDEVHFIKISKQFESQEIEMEQKIKELEEITEELEKNKDLLVEAERYAAVDQVAAQLAHNIRNPVTAIGGTARLLSHKINDPQQLNFLKMMIGSVEKAEQSLEDMLNFVDKSPPVKELIQIYPLIAKSLMLFYSVMQKHGIEHEVIMPDRNLMCQIDPQQIKRVFVHLIRNAVEAMEQGGRMMIEVATECEKMRVWVRDSGTGIAESDIRRATHPLYTTKPEGTGVGLALVSRIVSFHGGDLTIRRREGGGTEVEITLPL